MTFSGKLVHMIYEPEGGTIQTLAHFGLPLLSKCRWFGTFHSHNKISQHQYDFFTV